MSPPASPPATVNIASVSRMVSANSNKDPESSQIPQNTCIPGVSLNDVERMLRQLKMDEKYRADVKKADKERQEVVVPFIKDLMDSYERAMDRNNALIGKRNVLIEENRLLNEERAEFSEKCKVLAAKLEESERSMSKQSLQHKFTVEELKREYEDLECQLMQATAEYETAKCTIKNRPSITPLQEQIETTMKEKEELEAKLGKLRSNTTATIRQLETKNQQQQNMLKKQLEEVKKDRDYLQQRKHVYQHKSIKTEKLLKEKTEECERAKNRYLTLKEQNSEYARRIRKQVKEISDLKQGERELLRKLKYQAENQIAETKKSAWMGIFRQRE